MTTKEAKIKIANKKVMVLSAVIGVLVASVILAAIFIAYTALSSVYAAQPSNSTRSCTIPESGQVLKMVGSINTVQATKDVMKYNLKVSFSQAADTATRQITNGILVGGHVGVVQGKIFGVNPETHTAYHIVVDA